MTDDSKRGFPGLPKYTLDANGNPVLERDLLTWARWFETSGEQRKLGRTKVGPFTISTVFLGLPHSPFGLEKMMRWLTTGVTDGDIPDLERMLTEKEIYLWETMIFSDRPDEQVPDELMHYQERYASKEDALEGHKHAVEFATAHLHLEAKEITELEMLHGNPKQD